MTRWILAIALTFTLTACASQPGVIVEPVSVQAAQRSIDAATNTAQAAATQAAVATDSRRATEQTISDSQTSTAFPLAMQNTQAAMTATALPISVTQTAIVDGAQIAQAQTQAAYAEFEMTATALPTVAAAQATRQAQVESWQTTGQSVSGFGFGILQFTVFLFLAVVLVAISFALGAWVAYLWRPRFEGDLIIQPSLRGWTVSAPPALPLPTSPPQTAPVVDNHHAAQDAGWRAWFVDVLAEADSRGSLSFQQLADLFNNDRDKWFNNFAVPLVKLNMVGPVRQGKPTKPEPGWTIAAIRKVIEAGLTPPHPAGEPPDVIWPHQQSTVPTVETA